MNSATRFPRFGVPLLIISLAFVWVPVAAAQVARSASAGPVVRVERPADYQALPACVAPTDSFCVTAFEADPSGAGAMTTPPAGIRLDAHFFGSSDPGGVSFSFDVRNDGVLALGTNAQELAPLLPVGSSIRATVSTGAWKPPSALFATGSDVAWSRSYSAATGWSLTVQLRTIAYAVGQNCSPDDCSAPTNLKDFASFAQASAFANPSSADAQQAAAIAQNEGAWTATNASTFSPPRFDFAKQTINISLAGPHLTAAGVQNDGLFQSFIPNALVAGLWGSDPAELVSTHSLLMTKTEAAATTAVAPTVSIVSGGLLVALVGFHYSSPTFVISVRPSTTRITLGRPVGKTVKITFAAAKGARSYQAICTRGSVKRTATSRLPRVVVGGLTAGSWSCRGRTRGATPSRWSLPRLVRIA